MHEITIILKDNERTYKQVFLCYQTITLYHDYQLDPFIEQCVKEAQNNFIGDPDDIIVKITMDVM